MQIFLSHRQIQTYLQCPLKYFFLDVQCYPSRPRPYYSLGRSLHLTLARFHAQNPLPGLEELRALYRSSWLEHIGFSSPEEEEEYFAQGEKMIEDYFREWGNGPNRAVLTDASFQIELEGCVLLGRLDRVDRTEKGAYEVIDYRTDRALMERGVLDTSLNLSIQYLGCKELLGTYPEKLSLYFLRYGKALSTTREPSQAGGIAHQIEEIARQIVVATVTEQFPKNENKFCPWCDFYDTCIGSPPEAAPVSVLPLDAGPLRRAYHELKTAARGAILFMQVGPHYHIYGKDAEAVCRALRRLPGDIEIPCSEVILTADNLIRRGFSVAVADEIMESKSDGVAQREIVRFFSSDSYTVIDLSTLPRKERPLRQEPKPAPEREEERTEPDSPLHRAPVREEAVPVVEPTPVVGTPGWTAVFKAALFLCLSVAAVLLWAKILGFW